MRILTVNPAGLAWTEGLHLRSALPAWLLVALLAGALAYAAFFYRRERLIRPPVRVLLGVLRFAALAVLLVCLFAPVATVTSHQRVRPSVVVLVDSSLSMDTSETRKFAGELSDAATATGVIPFADPELQLSLATAAARLRQWADASTRDAAANAAARGEAQKAMMASAAMIENRLRDGLLAAEAQGQFQEVLSHQQRLAQHSADAANGTDPAEAKATGEALTNLAGELEQLNANWLQAVGSVPEDRKRGLSELRRLDLVKGVLLNSDYNLLEHLSRDFDVRLFQFSGDLAVVSEPQKADFLRPAREADGATRLGDAIEQAVALCAGRPVAGVILLTDGASTGGADPVDVAMRMRAASIPLLTVGVGLPQPDDVHLRSAAVQEVAFTKDLVRVRAQVVSRGYELRDGTLRILLDEQEVQAKHFAFSGGSQVVEAFFVAGNQAGSRSLRVAVDPMPGESNPANNVIDKPIRIIDDRIRVLFIEGSPRWEYRYLRGILKRDPRMEVKFITTEGDLDVARMSREHLARFPANKADAFKYDLVILGDARASTFSPGDFELLSAIIRDNGASLILLAGKKHLAEYAATPLAELLPVLLTSDEPTDVEPDIYPKLTTEGEQSTIMALTASEAKNRALWTKVMPLGWLPALGGAKPGATVLAELSGEDHRTGGYPLIAWHRYGTGKVLFVGTDRLFRLRNKAGDAYHRRFWSQAVQFLTLSRLLAESKRIRLEVDRAEVQVGQRVELYADVLDDAYEPSTRATFQVFVSRADAAPEELHLEAVPSMPGLYRGHYLPAKEGSYTVAPEPKAAEQANLAAFHVIGASGEQKQTAMDEDLLRRIGEVSGGRYLSLRELPAAPAYMLAAAEPVAFRREMELWDLWLVPVAFFALVGMEWLMRRRRDLA